MAHKETASKRIERLMYIITLVQNRRSGQRITCSTLAKSFDCDVKTVQRDINILREAFGIEYDFQQRTYLLPDNAKAIAVLSQSDVLSLVLTRNLLTAPGMPALKTVAATLDKIAAGLPTILQKLLDEASDAILPTEIRRRHDHAPLGVLLNAIPRHQTLTLDYESRSSGRRWRSFDPYAVEPLAGIAWMLHGFCHENQIFRTFAVDRIYAAEPTGTSFVWQEEEWQAFLHKQAVGGLRGNDKEGPIGVEVLFLPPVAAYAREIVWGDNFTLQESTEGVLLTGTASHTTAMVVELLRWRHHVRILGSPELLDAYRAELNHMMANLPPEKT